MEYYNEHKTGDLMTRFTSDLNAIRMAIGPAVICVFDASVMTIMVICQMMYYVNIRLTLLAIIPMLLICAGEIYYGKIMHARFRERQEAVSDLTDFVQESFSGVRVIKAFVRERSQMRAFARANRHTMDKNLNVVRLQAVVMPLLDVIIGLSSLITLVYGGYLALVGEITLGRFVASTSISICWSGPCWPAGTPSTCSPRAPLPPAVSGKSSMRSRKYMTGRMCSRRMRYGGISPFPT